MGDPIDPSSEAKSKPIGGRPEDLRNPAWYKRKQRELVAEWERGDMKPLDLERNLSALETLCQSNLGMTVKEVSEQSASALDRCVDALLLSEPDIEKLESIFQTVDDLIDDVKKKCLSLLGRVRALQESARSDPMKAWVYIGRDSEGDVPKAQRDRHGAGFFDPKWFHIAFWMAWEHPTKRRCLIMAPPGTGKTTCFRWWVATKIGRQPHLRICLLYDVKKGKADQEVPLLDNIVCSPRFRAIYPGLRVLTRADGRTERSSERFTVSRVNEFSREPTLEAYGILSGINGKGYDLIGFDDISQPQVRWQARMREDVNQRFDTVVRERLRRPATAEIKGICTPWHPEDVAGKIRERVRKGQEAGWLVLVEPFEIKDDQNGRAIPLWKERFDSTYLEERKLSPAYAQTHRLQARSSQERNLTRLWFYNSERNGPLTTPRDLELLDALAQSERWLSVDPSASSASYSSDHGILDIAVTPNGFAFCMDIWFLHMGVVAMENWLIRQIYFAGGNGYSGVQIEGQGSMKGQGSGWIHHIQVALETGRIPHDATEDADIVQMAPVAHMPEFLSTGTRMGGNVGQNVSKFSRFCEAAPYAQHGWIKFPGRRYKHPNSPEQTHCGVIPNSKIDRFQSIAFSFDGAADTDAIDAFSQWVLWNKHRLRDPHRVLATEEAQGPPETSMRRGLKRLLETQAERPDEREEEEHVLGKWDYEEDRVWP